jgi:ribonuclease P protein component
MAGKLLHAEGQGAAKSSPYQAKQGLSKPYSGFAAFDMGRFGTSRTLCKDERLSRRLLLDKLFAEGKSVSQNGFTLIYLPAELPVMYPAQMGFSVPKRSFSHANDRNAIKRLMREAYRHQKLPLYALLTEQRQQLAMMLLYKGKKRPDLPTVSENIAALLTKLIKQRKARPSGGSPAGC